MIEPEITVELKNSIIDMATECRIKADYTEALRYYLVGSTLEIPEWTSEAGACYQYGLGTSINLERALYFYRMAKEFGDEDAEDDIKNTLKKQQDHQRTIAKRNRHKTVKQPMLFRLQNINGNTLYILGTFHTLSSKIFPQSVQNIFAEALNVCTEVLPDDDNSETSSTDPESTDGEGSKYLRKNDTPDWMSMLSPQEQKAIVKYLDSIVGIPGDSYVAKKERLAKKTIGLIVEILSLVDTSLLREKLLEIDYKVDNAHLIIGDMDHEIESHFDNKYRLEDEDIRFERNATTNVSHDIRIKDLKWFILNHILHPYTNSYAQYQSTVKYFIEYGHARGIFDHSNSQDYILSKQKEENLDQRNYDILQSMGEHLLSLQGDTLALFGYIHLCGATGILCSLQRLGFHLEIFDPDNSTYNKAHFKPFTYTYQHWDQAQRNFKKSMLFDYKNRHNYCTDIIPYNASDKSLSQHNPRLHS